MIQSNRRGSRLSCMGQAGVTLVEILVAMVIITIGSLGILGALSYISKNIVQTRGISLATNLASEQIESMKDMSYFEILPTSIAGYLTLGSELIPYDTVYYPPETVAIGKGSYIRYTYVERMVANASGILTTVPHNSLDTGIKRMTVTVVWTQGARKRRIKLSNLISNPALAANAGFYGTVSSSEGGVIDDAKIYAMNNPSSYSYSKSDGSYAFSVTPGYYTLRAIRAGYYSSAVSAGQNITEGTFKNVDFTLTPMGRGSIAGIVWVNDHLVISQVVGSSNNASGFEQEWVEIFNPTTYTWIVNGIVGLKFQRPGDAGKIMIDIDYLTNTIAPGGFYLFANTYTITAVGETVNADATWKIGGNNESNFSPRFTAGTPNIITSRSDITEEGGNAGSGALELYRIGGAILDQFGWDRNNGSKQAPFYETEGLNEDIGLEANEQYVRLSSTNGYSTTLGPAYDSGNNNVDWVNINPLTIAPRNSASPTQTIIAGIPAVGAVITADDGLSASTMAYSVTSSPEHAYFVLTNVATGTWTVQITSSAHYLMISTVSVLTPGATTYIPNANTDPAWTVAGLYISFLSSTTENGTVTGSVVDPDLNPIADIQIDVHPAGTTKTNPDGIYNLPVPPGTYDVTANPNSINKNYTNATITGVTVSTGQVTSGQDFVLSGAGNITGYVCNYEATNAYPGIVIGVYDENTNLVEQAVSDKDGRFLVPGVTTGTYVIKPILDIRQTCSPTSLTSSTVAGENLHVGTFTITGAFGTITGSVTANGSNINTGVLIVATTGTIDCSAPPVINSDILSGIPYYMTSSLADGTYRLSVRTSTATATYNLCGWYTTYSGDTPTTVEKAFSAEVTGGKTTELKLAWP